MEGSVSAEHASPRLGAPDGQEGGGRDVLGGEEELGAGGSAEVPPKAARTGGGGARTCPREAEEA